ncbi:cellulose synthase complex periplasmic endoglucanase BcsZ [Xylophilus ampelinus]|uniref:cellulase n=1 Tax=Xylophilus ampelinus TaxID=54067 RepID=A0A318SLU3_9BURK|nr:cellulose synthase complex periplasmic endoglucanase BcsZ [Xylophilus ampelinus]MCS4510088.1 cellulose synthase complex periplasmic endoglucanase BcsZ [Xylophilus ampelinus]PYE78235.1 endoglucanase [Xylophilus ampelinus]
MLASLVGLTLHAGMDRPAAAVRVQAWPLWQQFYGRFVAPDGRVIDRGTAREHSTSEGQAYAMFLSLVANDRSVFDRVWTWSVNNLAGGDLGARLPAWQWGRRDDGSWGVVDFNAASDADLWFAYALLDAGRRWKVPQYREDARKLMRLIVTQEVVSLPGFGRMLMPGPAGFVKKDDASTSAERWRINPSYLPLSVLQAFSLEDPTGPWKEMTRNMLRMVEATTPRGLVADWVTYEHASGFGLVPGAETGSYDAIRAYLWAGLAAPSRLSKALLRSVAGMEHAIAPDGRPPEFVGIGDGKAHGTGAAGFSAALVPYLHALGMPSKAMAQQTRAESMLLAQGLDTRYYDMVLALFGLGWSENRFRFLPSGQLWLPFEPGGTA